MTSIPFAKAHGAGNDFLFTWKKHIPSCDLSDFARAICDRHSGVGADGWYLVEEGGEEGNARLTLFNSDGSPAGLSGNGTRCAAAVLVDEGLAEDELTLVTGAGPKKLRMLERDGQSFVFEMAMGKPRVREEDIGVTINLSSGAVTATLIDVGNPQCSLLVDSIPEDWVKTGAEIERHPRFPDRTNVSFVRVLDEHTIEARFFERGAGATLSSGTGSMGAAVAAVVQGRVKSPVNVHTQAGKLVVRWDNEVSLVGPAVLVAHGIFYF